MAYLAVVTILASVLIGTTFARSTKPDILLERDETNEIQDSRIIPNGRMMLNGPMDFALKVPCQFDIVKTEKINGKCEKLGGTHVCIAEGYVLPFHQECMFTL